MAFPNCQPFPRKCAGCARPVAPYAQAYCEDCLVLWVAGYLPVMNWIATGQVPAMRVKADCGG